jgi:hypothetical protein
MNQQDLSAREMDCDLSRRRIEERGQWMFTNHQKSTELVQKTGRNQGSGAARI